MIEEISGMRGEGSPERFVKFENKIFNFFLLEIYITRKVFHSSNFVSVLTNFDQIVIVSSIWISLIQPFDLGSLIPKDILLPQQCNLTIVEGLEPSGMLVTQRRVNNLLLFLYFFYICLNIKKFPINMAKSRVLPPKNITLSLRNTVHKRIHRGIRGFRGPSVDDQNWNSCKLLFEKLE